MNQFLTTQAIAGGGGSGRVVGGGSVATAKQEFGSVGGIIARFGNTENNDYEYFKVSANVDKKYIYTISDLTFDYGKTLETQGTTGNKPVSYITALALINSSFNIHLDHRFVNVQEKIVRWKERAEDNNLYGFSFTNSKTGKTFFLTSSKNSKNSPAKFVVESVKVSNVRINGRGVWLSADLSVSIQEYAGTQSKIGILRKRIADFSDGTTLTYDPTDLYGEETADDVIGSGGVVWKPKEAEALVQDENIWKR